jgi:hypothetical protein
MKKVVLFGAAMALAAGSLWAAEEAAKKPAAHKMAASSAKMEMATPDEMKWGDAPPIFSAGAKLAVLEGNPFGTGYYTVALKMPDGYKIMPHWHPATERGRLSGRVPRRHGRQDGRAARRRSAGQLRPIPPKMHHFAFAARPSSSRARRRSSSRTSTPRTIRAACRAKKPRRIGAKLA